MSRAAVILGFFKPQNERLLIRSIQSLKDQKFKDFDIFIYDNSALPDSLTKTRELFPDVKIKRNSKNLGFAGGNNSAIREAFKLKEYEYIALLNDDTKVEQNWLQNLIKTAESDSKIGAVTSKLLFFEPYVRVFFSTQTFNPARENVNPNDDRDLGIKFRSAKFVNSDYSKKFYREGLYGFENDYSWTKDHFTIDLPIGSEMLKEEYELELELESPEQIERQTLDLKLYDFESQLNLKPGVKSYKIKIPARIIDNNKFNLIQNAGSGITAQLDGFDIGNLQHEDEVSSRAEIDRGQYDSEREVEMFCGAAVLFPSKVLKGVGLFDEYFFVYYEDADLSLRIRKAGYKIVYEPKAVVRHMHATSSSEYSPLFLYHIRKNKPSFVLKNFGIRANLKTHYYLNRDTWQIFKLAVNRRFKDTHFNTIFKVHLKSMVSFVLHIPSLLLKRFYIVKSN